MAAGGAFAGVLIANNIARLRTGLAEAQESWKALTARGLELGVEQVSGLQLGVTDERKERPTLTGEPGGLRTTVRVRTDAVHYAHTEVLVVPSDLEAVTVGVQHSPGGIFGHLKSWYSGDLEVGDAAFDAEYIVTARPAAAASAMLGPAVREKITALGGRLAGFKYSADGVQVLLVGVETDAAALSLALELASEAARFRV